MIQIKLILIDCESRKKIRDRVTITITNSKLVSGILLRILRTTRVSKTNKNKLMLIITFQVFPGAGRGGTGRGSQLFILIY